jgi:hypothetical protein
LEEEDVLKHIMQHQIRFTILSQCPILETVLYNRVYRP